MDPRFSMLPGGRLWYLYHLRLMERAVAGVMRAFSEAVLPILVEFADTIEKMGLCEDNR
jgi:hypothetical protein